MRLDEVAHEVLQEAKSVYKDREADGALTAKERQWKLSQKSIVSAFSLGSQFLTHFRHRQKMWLWEFVRLSHWFFSLLESEEERLRFFLGIGTLLFYHTKEGEEHGWHPFSRPLEEIYDEMVEREVEKRVKKKLRLKEIEEEVRGMEMKRS